MAELKNGFFYTTQEGETSFINISLDGKNISTSENGPTLEQSLSKQEKIEEKVISCLTDKSIDRSGMGSQTGGLVYPIDVSYYRNLIIYIGSQTMYNNINVGSDGRKDRLYIENGTTGWQYRIDANANQDYTYEWNLGIAKKLYVYDDDNNFYIYVGVIDNTTFQIDKITIEKNSLGDISYQNSGNVLNPYYESSIYTDFNTVYQTTLDDEYELNGFYVNEAGTMAFASLTDTSGSYLLTVNLTTSTSWGTPSGLITATSSRIHVCPDVFEEDRFYALYDNQAISVSGGADYQTALKTIQLPYTINKTNGHIDYFGGYIVYTTDGSIFYITNVATSETKQITCEDELLSFDASEIVELRVKKYTLNGELQFYIGTEDSRHIKFYSDTTSYVRVNYNFLSPYTKPILKICADPYKNTEKILIAYNSGRNQIRVLNENVGTAGAAYFAQEYDTLQKVEGYEDEINVLNAQVNIINNELDNLTFNNYIENIGNTNLHSTQTAGQYYYLGAEGPISRQAGEYILVDIGQTGIGYGGVYQKLYYPTQKRQFVRYKADTSTSGWSIWQEILTSTDFDNFKNGKLAVYDNKTGFKTSDLDVDQVLTYNSKLLTDNYNPESFLSRGSYYNVGPNKTSFEDMTGSIGDIALSAAYEEGSYPYSIVANNNSALAIPAVYNSAFTSYTQGETKPFYFSLGMILDYSIAGLGQQEVFKLFNALVLHMNSSSTRIVATTGANGTALQVSNWLPSSGLCALAISGTNNGTVTLEIQSLYNNYTKKGDSVSASISLAGNSLYYNSSNKNSHIYLRQGINFSSLYLDSGSYIINSGTNPVLSTTEIINALVNIKQDASSPLASENYVDNKINNIDLSNKADKQTSSGGFAGGQGAGPPTDSIIGQLPLYGGAVGKNATATSGGAVGNDASTTGGGAVGEGSSSTIGGAVGYQATTTEGGGAVGADAKTSNGFAGGYNAKTQSSSGAAIDAIQLGTGTNSEEKTLQVYSYQLMDADGQIPEARMSSLSSAKHTHTNKTVLDAITSTKTSNWDTAYSRSHTHSNKSALDSITTTKITNWDTAYTDKHAHSNKAALDSITTTKMSNWDTAYTNRHTHSNKTVLDSISSDDVSNWDGKANAADLPNIKKNSTDTSGDRISTHLTVGSRLSGNTIGTNSFTSGYGNVASGAYTTAIGSDNKATGNRAIAVGGTDNTASGSYTAIVGGRLNNIADSSFYNAILGGYENSASDNYTTVVGGATNEATKWCGSILGGQNNINNGESSVILGGGRNTTSGYGCATIASIENEALEQQIKSGHYATNGTAGTKSGTSGDAFIIGNGTSSTARSNAFRVTYAGHVYGKASYHSSGADYAEYFEWEDGNSNNEDRRGLFVTLDGDKIKIASPDDDIIGIVSAAPSIVGNTYDDEWQGKYKTDIFGQLITQVVHHDAVYSEIEVFDTDEDGKELDTRHTEQILVHEAYDAEEYVLSDNYDPSQEYIPRSQRKEWAVIGIIGQLVVVDDGSCYVNGYCKVGKNGMATMSSSGYRVLSRLDENHIKIYVK